MWPGGKYLGWGCFFPVTRPVRLLSARSDPGVAGTHPCVSSAGSQSEALAGSTSLVSKARGPWGLEPSSSPGALGVTRAPSFRA